jgi:hypothetical protein
MPTVNIGSLLRENLGRSGISVAQKSATGSTYFNHFSEADYTALLVSEIGEADVILDGLRVHAALPHLREKSSTTLIYRAPDASVHWVPTSEPYREDLRLMAAEADITVPWAPSRESLRVAAIELLDTL